MWLFNVIYVYSVFLSPSTYVLIPDKSSDDMRGVLNQQFSCSACWTCKNWAVIHITADICRTRSCMELPEHQDSLRLFSHNWLWVTALSEQMTS